MLHQQHGNQVATHQWAHEPFYQQTHHQHAQQAAVTVAQQQAQQQHYNRIAANHNAVSHSIQGQDQNPIVTEDNQRVLGWIADLLSEDTREAALLELSKKREQVPELALILWHSFGEGISAVPIQCPRLTKALQEL